MCKINTILQIESTKFNMLDMKKVILLACMLCFISLQAQVEPKYDKVGDLVKATYFYEDGTIREQGFFFGPAADMQGSEFLKGQRGQTTNIVSPHCFFRSSIF